MCKMNVLPCLQSRSPHCRCFSPPLPPWAVHSPGAATPGAAKGADTPWPSGPAGPGRPRHHGWAPFRSPQAWQVVVSAS